MYRSFPQRLSYLSTLPSELLLEVLLALPPREIISKDSDIEELERGCSQDTFWERVWLKWVSPRLFELRGRTIQGTIYELVEEAERLTPGVLLTQESSKEILFFLEWRRSNGGRIFLLGTI